MLDLYSKKHQWVLGGFEYLHADGTVEADPGSGGSLFAVDDAGGAGLYPYTKMVFGGSGTQTPVSSSNPMPVGGSGASALGKAIDAVAGATDVGVPGLLIRDDALTTLTPADGDWTPGRVDSVGRTWVNGSGVTQPVSDASGSLTMDTPQLPSSLGQAAMAASVSVVVASDQSAVPVSAASLPLPSGAATAARQDTQTTSLQLLDDVIVTDDAAFTPGTTKVSMVGAEFDDSSPDGVDEGDAGALRMSSRRELYIQVRDAAGNERGLNITAGGAAVVDGSGVTQPVSAASLPLPTGAATAAKQPALGTAGSASADVLSVQGIASMTALQVADNGGSLTMDFSGQKTSDYDSGAGTDTVLMVGLALPASGGAVQGGTSTNPIRIDPTGSTTQPVSLASVPSHAVTNAGTFAVQDSQKVADNAAFTDGTTPVNPSGYIFDEVAGTALTENDIGAARMDSKRAQVLVLEDATTRGQRQAVSSGGAAEVHGEVAHDAAYSGNPVGIGGYGSNTPPSDASTAGDMVRAWFHLDGSLAVTDKPRTAGGLTIHRRNAAGTSGDATNVKASAGQLYGAIITNINAAVRYVKLYNSASAPTAGSGTPVMVLAVPGNTAGAGMTFNFDKGIAFSSGIGFTIVTGAGDSSSTSVTADEVIVNLFYA